MCTTNLSRGYKDYLSLIRTGKNCEEVSKYLRKSVGLCNEASIEMDKMDFSINLVVFDTVKNDNYMGCHGDLKKEMENRILLISNCLKLLFIFSKNLLTNFDVYREKEIQESNPQLEKFLKWLPNYQNYMKLIGYKLGPNGGWIYEQNKNQTKLPISEIKKLIEFSIFCCIGIIAYQTPSFMMMVSLFNQDCLQVKKILPNLSCDSCSLNSFDEHTFQCNHCENPAPTIWTNTDFIRRYRMSHSRTTSLAESYQFYFSEFNDDHSMNIEAAFNPVIDSMPTSGSPTPYRARGNNGKEADWSCDRCTAFNTGSLINCFVCNTSRDLRTTFTHNVSEFGTLSSVEREKIFDLGHNPEVSRKSVEISRSSHMRMEHYPYNIEDSWTCIICTFKNPVDQLNCLVCQSKKTEDIDKVNEKLAKAQLNKSLKGKSESKDDPKSKYNLYGTFENSNLDAKDQFSENYEPYCINCAIL